MAGVVLSSVTWATRKGTPLPSGLVIDNKWWELVTEEEFDRRVSKLNGGKK